ncbi:MAG: hypothetical protein D6732_29660 [Methanobacteriota archaeon]|nr:MAG: hypothetical protein D6732_29660 [Euryarchaeota archaeon]
MDLFELTKYNQWANAIYRDYCLEFQEQDERQLPGTGKSLKSILMHGIEVYSFWFSVLDAGGVPKERPSLPDDFKDLIAAWERLDQLFIEKVTHHQRQDLTLDWGAEWTVTHTNSSNVLFNLIGHNTYHRGQMALVLRYLGKETIAETDFNPYIDSHQAGTPAKK